MLKFWELGPSPNSIKVRMALRFKGVDFEVIPVDPFERAGVIEVSGQELTPVIADRGVVINDSEAILQYLDANYPDTPRLIPRERAGRKACDAWKRRLDREVAAKWSPIFSSVLKFGDPHTPEQRQAFEDALRALEEELGQRSSFDPDAPIVDLRVAEWATYALPGTALIERVRLWGKFREAFGIETGSLPALERMLEPWNERLG
jgi:glutathione S-transferase